MNSESQSLIRLDDVDLGYGKRVLLRGVSLEIGKSEFWGIVGPNGSGKTTLLRAILGWVPTKKGVIEIAARTHIGYVPQRSVIDALLPLTALEIVLMGLYAKKAAWRRMNREDEIEAIGALRQVGLESRAKSVFSVLSGGQQQRVLLARALVSKPDLLILDEPTNGMDIVSEDSVMKVVRKIHEERGMTIILVTHLLPLVAHHANRVGLIHGDRMESGETKDLITTERLSRLYGVPVQVAQVSGHTVVTTA
jgi:ABC-type Mn2+/Zn2+ transport system ATPase subunit